MKIDKSFMITSETDESNAAIIRTILALASSLKLKVIAEGVETANQASFLLSAGCDEAQGFYFSRPIKARDAQNWLNEHSCTDQASLTA